ncbi:hypothetical protein Tco_0109993 [Tanacetum coccineum]
MLTALTMLMLLTQMKSMLLVEKQALNFHFDPNMSALEDYSIFDFSRNDEDDGAMADMNNLDTTIQVSHIPTTRIHKDHPLDQVIRDLQSATQTRKMSKNFKEHEFEEPKKVTHALKNPSWIEAMQEELLQFKLQEVRTLVDLPNGKRVIGSKWGFKDRKDERGIVIEAIRLFLAYASFKDFMVYQMDVKSTFLYGKIEKEMSYIGELYFLLGLQDIADNDGIFISQDKYVVEILKKFGFMEVKTASTPMETQKPLLKYEDGKEVYTVNPKVSHLYAVKRIFSNSGVFCEDTLKGA